MKKWSICGRAGTLVALVLVALAAAIVSSADPGVGVASTVTAAAAPVTQALPAAPAVPTAPAAPVPSAPAVPAVPAAPAVPAVAAVTHAVVSHVSVAAKAKASVSVSKAHTITINSAVSAQAKVGRTHVKASTSSKTQVSKHKVTTARVIASSSSGPCAGYPAPPYNCSQLNFDSDTPNTCNGDMVHLNGYYHEIVNVQVDPFTGSMTIFHHINWQQMKGVALNDGNPYSASDVTKDEQETIPLVPGLTFHVHTEHQEENELISRGPDPNQLIHTTTVTDVDVDPLSMTPSIPQVTFSGFGLKCTG